MTYFLTDLIYHDSFYFGLGGTRLDKLEINANLCF